MTQRTENNTLPQARIGRPTPEMFPAMRELWRVCFDDPEPIADFIFRQIIRAENTRVLADGQGIPLSMLFIQPARLRLAGEPCPASKPDCAYIYGVATRPDRRGQGLSTRLLEETARDLASPGQSQVRALTLVPSGPELVGYYARQGFSGAFSHQVIHLTPDQLEQAPAPGLPALTPRRLADLADLRGQSLADSPLALLWERDFLEAINEECRLYRGEVLYFETPGAEGYLVYYRDEGQGGILIKEYLEALRPGGFSPLPAVMGALHRRLRAPSYTLRLRPDHPAPFSGRIAPFGMIRLLGEPTDNLAAVTTGAELGYLAHAMD